MHLVDDHDIRRSEDDGNIPTRIGVPDPVRKGLNLVLGDSRPEKPRHRDNRAVLQEETAPAPASRLIMVGSDDAGTEPAEAPKILDHRGEEVSSLTWDSFLAWRRTKCRPFEREMLASIATNSDDYSVARDAQARLLEEIDQATLELVGEVAELGQLLIEVGPGVFFGDHRDNLIDECGDILFCGAWAMDAWGLNPLAGENDDLELIRVNDGDDLAMIARFMVAHGEAALGDGRFVSVLGQNILSIMLSMQTNAGLLCNSFKKLRYQRRQQNVKVQVERIVAAMFMANQILIIANSSVEEALQINQRKLNARYPDGYTSGQGGGIRTGEGK